MAGVDADGDLAVLEVDTGDASAIPWAEDGPVEAGTVVFAVANPGGRGVRTTFGTVSATSRSFRGPRGRRIAGGVEHTAALPRGSSGGPVVDGRGRLRGINTHRVGDGFYLALPTDDALRARLDALGRGEAPARPRLGLALAPAGVAASLRAAVGLSEREGLLVRGLESDGPADRAGVRAGDLVVAADGQATATPDELFDILGRALPGGRLRLDIVRATEERTVTVTFDEGADPGDEATA